MTDLGAGTAAYLTPRRHACVVRTQWRAGGERVVSRAPLA